MSGVSGSLLALPLLIVAVAYFVIHRILQYRRLQHFSGPFSTGLSWWWHSRAVISGQAHRYYGEVTEKHGASMLATTEAETVAHR